MHRCTFAWTLLLAAAALPRAAHAIPIVEIVFLESGTPVIAASPGDSVTAEIRITFNPLVWWVWYGGIIMAIGGLIVMWPQATRSRSGKRTRANSTIACPLSRVWRQGELVRSRVRTEPSRALSEISADFLSGVPRPSGGVRELAPERRMRRPGRGGNRAGAHFPPRPSVLQTAGTSVLLTVRLARSRRCLRRPRTDCAERS